MSKIQYRRRYTDEWFLFQKLGIRSGPYLTGKEFREWYVDGRLHREGAPAFMSDRGLREWWANGFLHRLDGPAIICPDGSQEWWVGGREIDVMEIFGYLPSVPLSEEEQMLLALSVT